MGFSNGENKKKDSFQIGYTNGGEKPKQPIYVYFFLKKDKA